MSERMTITEALAEVKLTGKKVAAEQVFIREHLYRQASLVDPLETKGGSVEHVRRRLQSIRDMYARLVRIRSAIQNSNMVTHLNMNGVDQTVAEWLIWKREVADVYKNLLTGMAQAIASERRQVSRASSTAPAVDLLVHLDEAALSDEIKGIEETLGKLDGQLSLLNATVVIEF